MRRGVALQATLAVVDSMGHSKILLNLVRMLKYGCSLMETLYNHEAKSQNMKLPVGELLVLGYVFRQLF